MLFGRGAAESGREPERKTGRAAGKATCNGGGGEKWDMYNFPKYTAQLKSIRIWLSKNNRDAIRRVLHWREMDEQAVGKVKRLLWILY